MSRPKCGRCKKNFAKPGSDPLLCRTCARDTVLDNMNRSAGNPNPKCSYNEDYKCRNFAMKGSDVCLKHHPDQNEARRLKKVNNLKKIVGHNQRTLDLLTGKVDVSELDDQELIRGKLRNATGGFGGAEPSVVPKALYDKMISEIYRRADERLQKSLLDVVEMFVQIMSSDQLEPKDRLKAGMWIFERVRGKVPDNVHVSGDKPFQQVIEKIFSGPRLGTNGANAIESYVDAEIVEDDE